MGLSTDLQQGKIYALDITIDLSMMEDNISRRRFFSTTSILAGVVCAGCIGTQSKSNARRRNSETPAIIESVELHSGDDIDIPRGPPNPPETPPSIEYNSQTNSLSIVGEIQYSSNTCDELYINSLSYNDEINRIIVNIGYRKKSVITDNYCSDATGIVPYRLDVILDAGNISEVEIVETHYFPNKDNPDVRTLEEL